MDNNSYPKIREWINGTVLVWALIFFGLLNGLVWAVFRNSNTGVKRLESPVSYRELDQIIKTVEADTRPKVVFLGASSIWGGGGISSPAQALPGQFEAFLATGTVAYNISFPAARPLDLYLLLYRLQGKADLFVVDISTAHLGKSYGQGVVADRTKYLRVQNLLQTQISKFKKDNVEAWQCLRDEGINPKLEWFFDFGAIFPIVEYKDAINRVLFGKHFSLFVSDVISRALNVRPGISAAHWSGLFSAPVDIAPLPGVTSTPNQAPFVPYAPSLNSCVTQAMAEFVVSEKIPAVFYISPHSPIITENYRAAGLYQEQLVWVRSLYGRATVFDPDTARVLYAGDFYDETHFYPAGHQRLAEWLWLQLKETEFKRLFK